METQLATANYRYLTAKDNKEKATKTLSASYEQLKAANTTLRDEKAAFAAQIDELGAKSY
jgi:hypothetical protein